MEDNNNTIVIHARVPKQLDKQLRHLVNEGYYSNVSDALRDAARKLVESHGLKHITDVPKFELKHVKF